MRASNLAKLDKVSKFLLPGEAEALAAYLSAQDIVESIAINRQGYEPDLGYRPMTAVERIQEFNTLSIEQKNAIIEDAGMAWYLSYSEEIQKLKDALPQVSGGTS